MYALENQLVETLEKHADQAEKFPNVQAKIREHLEQTKQHRTWMEQRLRAYGDRRLHDADRDGTGVW